MLSLPFYPRETSERVCKTCGEGVGGPGISQRGQATCALGFCTLKRCHRNNGGYETLQE